MIGEVHKRQRSIMAPGFGQKESKEFFPIFKECAESLSTKWLEAIQDGDGQAVVLNVLPWLSRGALDAIGQGIITIFLLEDTCGLLTSLNSRIRCPIWHTPRRFAFPRKKICELLVSFLVISSGCCVTSWQWRHFRPASSKASFHTSSSDVYSDVYTQLDFRTWFTPSACTSS